MPIINPPAFMQTGTYSARVTRMAFNDIFESGGVTTSPSFSTIANVPNAMNVFVGSGTAYILGTEIYGQGMYFVNSESAVVVPILPNNGGGTRKDTVYVGVKDSNISGGLDVAVVDVAVGTEGNLTPGVPPKNSTPLAVVTVNVGATAITPADVQNVRVYPRLNGYILSQDFQSSMPGWTALTPATNWSNYSASDAQLSYRTYAGKVELQGLVKYTGTAFVGNGVQSKITTLPASVRPSNVALLNGTARIYQLYTNANTSGPAAHQHNLLPQYEAVRLDVDPDGSLYVTAGSNWTFAQSAQQWVTLAGVWYPLGF